MTQTPLTLNVAFCSAVGEGILQVRGSVRMSQQDQRSHAVMQSRSQIMFAHC